MKTKLYGAYAINLNKEQMALRCPDAKAIGTSTLKGIGLMFDGVAGIERHPGRILYIGIWEISEEDEKKLDEFLNFPKIYFKKNFILNVNGEDKSVMLYVKDSLGKYKAPDENYLATIKQGYKDFNIADEHFEYNLYRYNSWAKLYGFKIAYYNGIPR